MSYVALYRKFRPGTFSQVVGQDHVVRALENQLINNRIGHAYLFTGTRGTGKTSAAKIFAKAVNCLHPVGAEPCNECENCRSINAGNFVDVVEVDAASNNGVDDIRQIIEEVRYTPVKGKYKVFIIDEAHMITGPAFNAFLKTLEEPPAYAIFILATTEPHKLPVTILSRVQRYDFRRISTDRIAGNLKEICDSEGVGAQEKALKYIARIGDGSMRDSVSLLDKCIAFNLGESLTYENVLDTLGAVDTESFSRLLRCTYGSDAAGALSILDGAVDQGRDLSQFATDFIWYLRNVLMAGASDAVDMEMLGVSAENLALIREDARMIRPDVLMRYIRIVSELIDRMRFSSSKQILFEVALIKLAKPQMEEDVQSLADRIRQLEARNTAAPTPGAAYNSGPAPTYGGYTTERIPERTFHATAAKEPSFQRTPALSDSFQAFAPEEDNIYPDAVYATPAESGWEGDDFGPGGLAARRMSNPDAFAGLFDDFEASPAQQPGRSTFDQPASNQFVNHAQTNRQMPMQSAAANESHFQAQGMQTNLPNGSAANANQIWQGILQNCDSRMIKTALNKCSCRMAEEDTLEILAPSAFLQKQLKDEQVQQQLTELASRSAGKPIHIKVSSGRTQAQGTQGMPASGIQITATPVPDAVTQGNLSHGYTPERGSDVPSGYHKPASIPGADSVDMFPEELLKNINFTIGTEES